MDVLVLGANGLLGSNVVAKAHGRQLEVVGIYHSTAPTFDTETVQLDITDTQRFTEVLDSFEPAVIINCAAMTDVDRCEEYPEQAREINGEAPGRLAAAAAERDIEFVHVSTDYVFDGEITQLYAESADPAPIQAYGRSKFCGERRVTDSHPDPIIPRLSFVYGQRGDDGRIDGFPAWVRDRFNAGDEIPLFTDQKITPTRAGQAADTILDLVEAGSSGVYHVASRSCVSPYEFGNALVDQIGGEKALLVEGSLDDIDRPARRPVHTCLSVETVESTLGRSQPTLEQDIAAIQDVL